MNEVELIEKWDFIGLLEYTPDDHKAYVAQCLENTEKYLQGKFGFFWEVPPESSPKEVTCFMPATVRITTDLIKWAHKNDYYVYAMKNDTERFNDTDANVVAFDEDINYNEGERVVDYFAADDVEVEYIADLADCVFDTVKAKAEEKLAEIELADDDVVVISHHNIIKKVNDMHVTQFSLLIVKEEQI